MQVVNMKELQQEVVTAAKKLAEENLYCIYLYGSYARGDYDDESDIDIMVIIDCKKETVSGYRKRMSHYASLLGLKFDKQISILIRDKEDFYAKEEILPFYKNVISEGVIWYEQ